MKDLLIEIGTEELPAGVILPAVEFLREKFAQILHREDIKTFATPRRMAFFVKNFENISTQKEEIVWGPPLKVAYEKGKPTRALLAFLEKNSASLEDVLQLPKGEGEYVAIKRITKESTPLEKLAASFEDILQSVPFPKNMRWNSSGVRFSRPVRWICALYGQEVLPLYFGQISSSNKTQGHRILSPEWVEISSPVHYQEILKEKYVIVDYKERLGLVLAFLKDESYNLGGVPSYPEGLEEEVANLVEFPFAVVGSFDPKYLELPPKVITTVLAHHQRFFCVEKEGKLLPYFIGISNNYPRNGILVRGYEKVIRARLEDAFFFYKEDLRKPLEELVPGLSEVLFHPRAGSMLEKVRRVGALASRLAEMLNLPEDKREKLERAVYLSKADLLTQMVRELDELQGYVGYVYALKQGEDDEVARAIYEHYLPSRPSDPTPSGIVSAVLSVADKFDSLHTLISIGESPSGSSDPYGMRRLAYGIFAVVDAFGWNLNLADLIDNPSQELTDFLKSRLEAYLDPYGLDLVRGVLEVKDPLKPYEVITTVKTLANLKQMEEFKIILETYRRVVKILPSGWGDDMLDEGLLVEKEEKELWQALRGLEGVENPLDLAELKQPVDNFFDRVHVMVKEDGLRRNRLALLFRAKRLFNRFADFSKITV